MSSAEGGTEGERERRRRGMRESGRVRGREGEQGRERESEERKTRKREQEIKRGKEGREREGGQGERQAEKKLEELFVMQQVSFSSVLCFLLPPACHWGFSLCASERPLLVRFLAMYHSRRGGLGDAPTRARPRQDRHVFIILSSIK